MSHQPLPCSPYLNRPLRSLDRARRDRMMSVNRPCARDALRAPNEQCDAYNHSSGTQPSYCGVASAEGCP